MDTDICPDLRETALRIHAETGRPMGWCMNQAIEIVRAWAVAHGEVD